MSEIDDLKGKGRKAFLKLEAIKEEIHSIKKQLEKAREILVRVIPGRKVDDSKNRYTKKDSPKRVEFECNHLEFYIDFAMALSESSDPTNIQGIIIYGARRTLCFPDFIMEGQKSETKALIQFSVNRHGIIQSNDAFDDTWSLKDKEHDLLGLHYRALDSIWGQALGWTNENILP